MKPEVLEESVDTSDLPIPPDFPLPDAAFAFPECQVSSSALELLKLVRIILRSEMWPKHQLEGGEGVGLCFCLEAAHRCPFVPHGWWKLQLMKNFGFENQASLFMIPRTEQVRNVFTLWCAVTPTFHRDAIESLPQVINFLGFQLKDFFYYQHRWQP